MAVIITQSDERVYTPKDAYIIKSLENPKVNSNLTEDNLNCPLLGTENFLMELIWLNESTGELFICTDNTIDVNVWVGQLGTIISSTKTLNISIDEIENNGLVAHYDFNSMTGKNFKSSKNNINGNTKNVCNSNDSIDGKSIYFKGNGYMKLAQPNLFQLDDFTICYWVKPRTWWWNQNHFWKDQKNEFGIFQDTDLKMNLTFGNSEQNVLCSYQSSFTLDLNDWNHITIKRENGIVSFYKNKVVDTSLVKTGDTFSTIGTSHNHLYFGTGNRGGFKGYMDDVYIFNRGLSNTEISTIQEKFQQGETNVN